MALEGGNEHNKQFCGHEIVTSVGRCYWSRMYFGFRFILLFLFGPYFTVILIMCNLVVLLLGAAQWAVPIYYVIRDRGGLPNLLHYYTAVGGLSGPQICIT